MKMLASLPTRMLEKEPSRNGELTRPVAIRTSMQSADGAIETAARAATRRNVFFFMAGVSIGQGKGNSDLQNSDAGRG
jgi:hypothetical protein